MSNEIATLIYHELQDHFETEKAYCFIFSGHGITRKDYLPKSQVEDIRESANEVDVPLWLVESKGLEDYLK